jgi:hypothetical protein
MTLLRLLLILLLLNALAMLFGALLRPAAAGTRDTPLCKQDYSTTIASLNESSARIQRIGNGKSEEACFAYQNYFLSVVKARTMTAQCKLGPERDQDLARLDAGAEQANAGIAARCG